jgi:hypothetical protein
MGRGLLFLNVLLVFCMLTANVWAENTPQGPFSQQQCLDCHKKTNPQIVAEWGSSSHATATPPVDCTTCHGITHEKTPSSRQNPTCINCHNKFDKEATNSYRLSKHGIIATIEAKSWDWSQPLADGNYRTPTCAYCHMHDGDHSMGGKKKIKTPEAEEAETSMERRIIPCYDCHSPRFATTWFKSGERMIAIALMKVREAKAVWEKIEQQGDNTEVKNATSILQSMNKKHFANVKLGIFHQSPDHQWWHGQPALDGDLLRLKGLLGDVIRRKNIKKLQSSE